MNNQYLVPSLNLFAALAFTATCLLPGPLLADQKLDEMMEQMGSKSMGSYVKNEARRTAQYVYQGISAITSGISSWLSSVSTPPAEDIKDYAAAVDSSESGSTSLGRLWQSASGTLASAWQEARADAEATADAIRNFPLPHAYWAPGIVEDYTNVMFDRVDQEFFPH